MRIFLYLIALCLFLPPAMAGQDLPPEQVAAAGAAAKAASEEAVFGGAYIGEIIHYKTEYEDTLVKLARDHDLGFVEVRAANPLVDPWLPGAGVKMILPAMHLLPDAPRRGIVINLPEMRLYYFDNAGSPPASYPIGIGREGLLTPTGKTSVRSKIEGPTWRPTPRMRAEDPELPEVVPPGPDNPLGTHALYLGWAEYRIHGTNKPYGIGRRSSSGCIRMYPEDIVRLYPAVSEGTPVTVVDQPVKVAWIDDEFYLEVHPTMKQADRMELDGGMPTYEMTEADMRTIIRAAGPHADLLDWKAIRRLMRERNGYPVAVGRRPRLAETPQGDAPDSSAGPRTEAAGGPEPS